MIIPEICKILRSDEVEMLIENKFSLPRFDRALFLPAGAFPARPSATRQF